MSKEDVGLHPVVEQIYDLGCKSTRKVSLALQVYFDLCEVKCMWDTDYAYNSKLDLIYITGKWNKNDIAREVVVPLSASSSISPASLLELQNELFPNEERKMLTLAFVAGDSSICYYHTQSGLHPPDSPETVRRRRLQEERRQCRAVEVVQKARELLTNIIESSSVQDSK